MGNCNDNNDDGGVDSGVDCGGFHEDDKADDKEEDTASISSSSSSSLTSSDENDATTFSSSNSSSISSSNEFGQDQANKNLWWIHGNGYDLMDFVQDHPGGIEAILLGKGRDCTALVESYHAFSGDRVWKILEKHRTLTRLEDGDGDDEIDELATATSTGLTEEHRDRVPDFFYEVLKKRVTKVLRFKGIDPVKDRGASQIRIAYYLLIFGLWLYAGYLHCSVSIF